MGPSPSSAVSLLRCIELHAAPGRWSFGIPCSCYALCGEVTCKTVVRQQKAAAKWHPQKNPSAKAGSNISVAIPSRSHAKLIFAAHNTARPLDRLRRNHAFETLQKRTTRHTKLRMVHHAWMPMQTTPVQVLIDPLRRQQMRSQLFVVLEC